MRTLIVLALLAAAVAPRAARGGSRTIVCCLEVVIPGLGSGSRCGVVTMHVRRGPIAPRRVCRLAGGSPVRRGTCTCPPATVNPS